MITKRNKCLLLTLGLSLLLSAGVDAQNRVVVVPLFDSSPTGVSAIPVHCDSTGLVPEAALQTEIDCRRSDTRVPFTAVPNGHFLFITDLLLTNNGAGFGGSSAITVGRFDADAIPNRPRFDFRVRDLGARNHLTFSTPHLILKEGESIGAANTDINDTATTANLVMSGYLIKADGFGD